MFKPDTCCTLVPYFEIQEGQLDAFKAMGPSSSPRPRQRRAVCNTRSHGNTAHYREGDEDAQAVLSHLDNVGALLGEALKITKIVRLEVHGPAAEIDKLRTPLASLELRNFALEPGIRRA